MCFLSLNAGKRIEGQEPPGEQGPGEQGPGRLSSAARPQGLARVPAVPRLALLSFPF